MSTKTKAATATAPAAVATEQAPALIVDQYHGVGGEYVVENGVRRRVAGPPLDDVPAPVADTTTTPPAA